MKLAIAPKFLRSSFLRREWAIPWLVALAPYINYQLGRSLVWAVKSREGSVSSQHLYEVRPRKDHHSVDVISDALLFGRLWHCEPNAVSNAKAKRKAGALTQPPPAMGALEELK